MEVLLPKTVKFTKLAPGRFQACLREQSFQSSNWTLPFSVPSQSRSKVQLDRHAPGRLQAGSRHSTVPKVLVTFLPRQVPGMDSENHRLLVWLQAGSRRPVMAPPRHHPGMVQASPRQTVSVRGSLNYIGKIVAIVACCRHASKTNKQTINRNLADS